MSRAAWRLSAGLVGSAFPMSLLARMLVEDGCTTIPDPRAIGSLTEFLGTALPLASVGGPAARGATWVTTCFIDSVVVGAVFKAIATTDLAHRLCLAGSWCIHGRCWFDLCIHGVIYAFMVLRCST